MSKPVPDLMNDIDKLRANAEEANKKIEHLTAMLKALTSYVDHYCLPHEVGPLIAKEQHGLFGGTNQKSLFSFGAASNQKRSLYERLPELIPPSNVTTDVASFSFRSDVPTKVKPKLPVHSFSFGKPPEPIAIKRAGTFESCHTVDPVSSLESDVTDTNSSGTASRKSKRPKK